LAITSYREGEENIEGLILEGLKRENLELGLE
jgi:hypothetical protein